MTNWLEDFKNTKILVKSVLRDNEKARGDDKELVLAVWEKQGFKLTNSQKTLYRKLVAPETITRARRQIQETGLYRPKSNVYQQRQILEETVRKNINERA